MILLYLYYPLCPKSILFSSLTLSAPLGPPPAPSKSRARTRGESHVCPGLKARTPWTIPSLWGFVLAPEMLHKLRTTFPCSRLCPYTPGSTSVVAQALLVSGLTSTLVPWPPGPPSKTWGDPVLTVPMPCSRHIWHAWMGEHTNHYPFLWLSSHYQPLDGDFHNRFWSLSVPLWCMRPSLARLEGVFHPVRHECIQENQSHPPPQTLWWNRRNLMLVRSSNSRTYSTMAGIIGTCTHGADHKRVLNNLHPHSWKKQASHPPVLWPMQHSATPPARLLVF